MSSPNQVFRSKLDFLEMAEESYKALQVKVVEAIEVRKK
jgi:hypothetical protein